MSFMPLETTQAYYEAFLDGIRREYTSVVPPVVWNRIINEAELEWVMTKMPQREFVQKRIDDINVLRVATDNVFLFREDVLHEIKPFSGNLFPLPRFSQGHYDASTGLVTLNKDEDKQQYPLYMIGCRIDFRLASSPTVWSEAKILRSDDRGHLLRSKFRSPNVERRYYEISGDFVKAHLPSGETALGMNLEYYTYPRKVFFDEQLPTDSTAFPNTVNGISPYQPGYGSVNSIFEEYQKREIIDIAVRMFLERRSSERYKTMLNESSIKQSNK